MYTRRITSSFIAVISMACCLVLGGFTSQAAAHSTEAPRIVVTTLTDAADPPFNADGICGTGTLNDLPGTDGLISLREAIIAANNTPGADTITFAPNLAVARLSSTLTTSMAMLPLIPCLRSVGDRHVSRATPMAMTSRISSSKEQRFRSFLRLLLVFWSFPVTTPSPACVCNISLSGSWCAPGIGPIRGPSSILG